jgi:type VI secretion system protein
MPLIVSMRTTDPVLGAQSPRRLEIDLRLSIGRGSENDLVLPDPARVLSKNHCVIEAAGASYVVTDCSTNGVFLNNSSERLPRDVPMPIQPGDLLQIGGYLLEITGFQQPTTPVDDFEADFAPRAAPTASVEPDLFDELLDFVDDAAGSSRAAPGSANDFMPVEAPAFDDGLTDHRRPEPMPDLQAERPMLPDADDLFGPGPSTDEWSGGSQSDHVAGTSSFFAPPKITSPSIPDDWDDLLDFAGPGASKPPVPAARMPPQPIRNVFEEPSDEMRAAPVAKPVPAPTPVSASSRPATDADRGAAAALLKAAGLDGIALNEAEGLAMMERIGRMLSTLVPGLIEILAARGSTKQEFHIERTMLGAHDNNPLKFAGSADEAMRVMLLQHVPGFLAIDQAVDQAIGDIKTHQLAVLAGMQVALKTVIGRFEPRQLEARLERSSLLDGILPGARKARYWDLFRTLHGEIVHELQDDLQKLFGADFAEAYRTQIDRLAGGDEAK